MLLSAGIARAEVLNYTVTTTEDGEDVLTSVTVHRGGEQAVFDAERLIPVRVEHFKSSFGTQRVFFNYYLYEHGALRALNAVRSR